MSILFRKANLTDKSLDLANFNRMVDYVGRLANMTSPNMMIDRNPNGYVLKVLPSTSSTMSYSDWAFGFSISAATVTVNGGKVRHGARTPISVGGANILIATDLTWIYVSYPYGSGAATVESSTDEPGDDENEHNHALYLVRLISGVAVIPAGNISHLGDIWLPGNFA